MTGQVGSASAPPIAVPAAAQRPNDVLVGVWTPIYREISSFLGDPPVFRFLYPIPFANLSSCAFRLTAAHHRGPPSRPQKSDLEFDTPRLTSSDFCASPDSCLPVDTDIQK
jgi:hypothetical protein